MKIYKTTILFLLLDVCLVVGIILMNGPLESKLVNKLFDSKIAYLLWDED